jgi:hypothetical protein
MTDQHVIHDALQAADDIRYHRRPRDLPHRLPEWTLDYGPIVRSPA